MYVRASRNNCTFRIQGEHTLDGMVFEKRLGDILGNERRNWNVDGGATAQAKELHLSCKTQSHVVQGAWQRAHVLESRNKCRYELE